MGGYTAMCEKMLAGIEVRTNTRLFADKAALDALADKVLFTGMIDEYFGYRLGELEYRSLRFESEVLDTDNYQGTPWSTTRHTRCRIPALSSTSISSSAHSPLQS